MAKYIGTFFSTARNKFGGVVLMPTSSSPTLRQRHIPIRPASPGHMSQQAFFAEARNLWYSNPGEYSLNWSILASWLKYGDGPSSGTYTPVFPVWLSAQSNARILGATLTECTEPYPSPLDPLDDVQLSTTGDGSCTATASRGGAVITTPWVLYLTDARPSPGLTPPARGGAALGGSLSGAGFDCGAALQLATGRAPAGGQRYAIRAALLYPGSLVTALQFVKVQTVTGL
jgi:hypothetical protein